MLTSTHLQTATYLLGVCLSSISFVVFVSSTSSFLIRDLLNIQHGAGDLVGTLGFVDELVALVACPVWGILSDRIGVRTVCMLGYAIIGVSLFVTVQARNVYPQLLLARIFFALGGAATTTMVTAILPSMVAPAPAADERTPSTPEPPQPSQPRLEISHSTSPSVSSELTITPARLAVTPRSRPREGTTDAPNTKATSPPQLAGLVGLFTGCGALVALALFLPLPARFSQLKGVTPAQALTDSYYVVATIALLISVFCFFGLRNLRGEEEKGWQALRGRGHAGSATNHDDAPLIPTTKKVIPYATLFWTSIKLGFTHPDIGLSYLGGFVARASSVGITLFIPLFVSAYFHTSGLCPGDRTSTPPQKDSCRRAYVLAAELTGTTQLTALIFALPLGYLTSYIHKPSSHNLPLLLGALLGIAAYSVFPHLSTPEIAPSHHGSPVVLLVVALLGISQISAIVCSLGLLGSAVLDPDEPNVTVATDPDEEAPLLPSASRPNELLNLKGSLAGTYSLAGGAGILLLTKLGGWMFDKVAVGSPFYLLAGFNGVLFLVGVVVGGWREGTRRMGTRVAT